VRLLSYDFMQRALIAGALIGLAAPSIGVFIVQRRLALLGDGIGHVAFTGIAAGLLLGFAPVIVAIVFATAGAVVIELLRERDKTSGDVALALIFYGGIAGAVLLLSLANISTVNVNAYLFGSVLTVDRGDLAVAYDEDVARVSGLPVRALNIATAAIAAVTIAVTAKVVGILLVSSMLVLPVATVQQLTRSFRSTVYASLALGVVVTVGGLVLSYYLDVAPAATIVLSAIAAFMVAAGVRRAVSS
jgi:zinc transport system permease protein